MFSEKKQKDPRVENREDLWQDIQVLFLQTGEEHFQDRPRSVYELYQNVIIAQKVIRVLLDERARLQRTHFLSPEYSYSKVDSIFRALERAQSLIDDRTSLYKLDGLIDAPITSPLLLADQYQERHPTGTYTKITAQEGIRFEKRAITDALGEAKLSRILSISDSHRTTADMFTAMRARNWEYDPKSAAILSFDHHTDTDKFDSSDPYKATVMRWLLERQLVAAVGVVGIPGANPEARIPGTTFIEGWRLYHEDQTPWKEKFDRCLYTLFLKWLRQGIDQFYLSVDLDGLQLDKLGISATDYAIERTLWELIYRVSKIPPSVFKEKKPSPLFLYLLALS
jgi:hypothetical protein